MALTFTSRYEGHLDRKKLKIFDVTHDGSVTAINASDINLSYIDIAMMSAGTLVAHQDLSTNYGPALAMTALSSGSITTLWAIGS